MCRNNPVCSKCGQNTGWVIRTVTSDSGKHWTEMVCPQCSEIHFCPCNLCLGALREVAAEFIEPT
jgi:hypothetical protein